MWIKTFTPLGLPISQLQNESEPSENSERCDSLIDDGDSDYSDEKENSLVYKQSDKVSNQKKKLHYNIVHFNFLSYYKMYTKMLI